MSEAAARRAFWNITQFHESAQLIQLAQTGFGRFAMFIVAAAMLRPYDVAPFIVPAIGLVTLWPARRTLILSIAGLFFGADLLLGRDAILEGAIGGGDLAVAGVSLAILVGVSFLIYRLSQRFADLSPPLRTAPQFTLHLLFWLAVVLIWLLPMTTGPGMAVTVATVGTVPFLIWRLGYMIKAGQRGGSSGSGFHDHLFYILPAFGGSNIPVGKGFDYLQRCRAESAEDFARSQLAGIKVLILALLWGLVLMAMNGLVFGMPDNPFHRLTGGQWLGVPQLDGLIRSDRAASIPTAWLVMYVELVRITLVVAIAGHVIVGGLRLCGFNVFRNTYKPLLSESIVEFWNRFYYYYKEMLVEFFFLPTYLRFFRNNPMLRMFSAVFAAAFIGNLYYHVLVNADFLLAADFDAIWHYMNARVLYTFLLALGIFLSMQRQQRRRRRATATAQNTGVVVTFGRLRAIAGVWTFYGTIHIWNVRGEDLTFGARSRFFLSLFGLG